MIAELTKYFPWLAGAGVVASCYSQIKTCAANISSLVIVRRNLSTTDLRSPVLSYLQDTYPHIKLGEVVYETGPFMNINSIGKSARIWYADPDGLTYIFWINNSILYYSLSSNKNEATLGSGGSRGNIYYLRGTLNFEKIIEEAYKNYLDKNTLLNQKFRIIQVSGVEGGRSGTLYLKGVGIESKNLSEAKGNEISDYSYYINKELVLFSKEDVFLNGGTNDIKYYLSDECQKVKDFVIKWKSAKSWYLNKKLAWRLGVLLYGPPGSGKSNLVLHICKELNIPLYVFNLSTMNNNEFLEEFKKVKESGCYGILFEDIDSVYNGRNNLKENCGPNFDIFINCLSGVGNNNGLLTFITTNNLDKIDQAIKRPGRCDLIKEIGYFHEDQRRKMANDILGDQFSIEEINEHIAKTNGETPAHCAEYFGKLALDRYWNK